MDILEYISNKNSKAKGKDIPKEFAELLSQDLLALQDLEAKDIKLEINSTMYGEFKDFEINIINSQVQRITKANNITTYYLADTCHVRNNNLKTIESNNDTFKTLRVLKINHKGNQDNTPVSYEIISIDDRPITGTNRNMTITKDSWSAKSGYASETKHTTVNNYNGELFGYEEIYDILSTDAIQYINEHIAELENSMINTKN